MALWVCGATLATPIIGDDPIYIEDSPFESTGWALDVYSYACKPDSAGLLDLGVAPGPGEMLSVQPLGGGDYATLSKGLFSFSYLEEFPPPAPKIGGDPIHTEASRFENGGWGVDVYSYVYSPDSASLPDLGVVLRPDEMLFVYLLDGDDDATVSVPVFSVSNPEEAQINLVGWSDQAEVDGFENDAHESPDLYGYIGSEQATVFHFSDLFDQEGELGPDEWSLVYYRAIASEWTPVDAIAGIDETDTQRVPGAAVPEPATLILLGLGSLMFIRQRR